MTLDTDIISEIYTALETLGLGAVGSLRDTLDDREVLTLLRQWNQEQTKPSPLTK